LAEPEAEAFLKGSARIALEVDPPFKQYVFIEQDAGRAQELEKLKRSSLSGRRVSTLCGKTRTRT
jgi:hypothetical protein